MTRTKERDVYRIRLREEEARELYSQTLKRLVVTDRLLFGETPTPEQLSLVPVFIQNQIKKLREEK